MGSRTFVGVSCVHLLPLQHAAPEPPPAPIKRGDIKTAVNKKINGRAAAGDSAGVRRAWGLVSMLVALIPTRAFGSYLMQGGGVLKFVK